MGMLEVVPIYALLLVFCSILTQTNCTRRAVETVILGISLYTSNEFEVFRGHFSASWLAGSSGEKNRGTELSHSDGFEFRMWVRWRMKDILARCRGWPFASPVLLQLDKHLVC